MVDRKCADCGGVTGNFKYCPKCRAKPYEVWERQEKFRLAGLPPKRKRRRVKPSFDSTMKRMFG